MGFFDTIKEPVFLKESSSAEKQLEALKILQQKATGTMLKKIEQEIKLVEAGIYGENQIKFELKNSHMPIVVMHDLYFEKDGYNAQIDYLIITRGRNFIIECKNLIGDIEIDSTGNFIRTLTYGKYRKKEGLYSPITQNQRHMELIKNMRMEEKNIFIKPIFEKNFSVNYRSVIVLANSKTVLNAKYANKEIKNKVIRVDHLIDYIKKVNSERDTEYCSEKEMMNLAYFFLDRNKENPENYIDKYKQQLEIETEEEAGQLNTGTKESDKERQQLVCPKCGSAMIKRIAKKGTNAGKEFYGCSNFPKCRHIVNLISQYKLYDT